VRAVTGQEAAQLGGREVGAALGDQAVELQPATPVAARAPDLKVGQARGDLAEAQGTVGHDEGSSVAWGAVPARTGATRRSEGEQDRDQQDGPGGEEPPLRPEVPLDPIKDAGPVPGRHG
jgi:hypothetical protein